MNESTGNNSLTYPLLSLLVPVAGYLVFFLSGFAAGAPNALAYVPLLVLNAAGFAFSVAALARSRRKTVFESPREGMGALLGSIGIFANTIAFEIILMTRVF